MTSSYININRNSETSLDRTNYATDVNTLIDFVKGNNSIEPEYVPTLVESTEKWRKIATVNGYNINDNSISTISKNGNAIVMLSSDFSNPNITIFVKTNSTYIMTTVIELNNRPFDVKINTDGTVVAVCYISRIEFYIKNEINVFKKTSNNLLMLEQNREFVKLYYNTINQLVIVKKNSGNFSENRDIHIEMQSYTYNTSTNSMNFNTPVSMLTIPSIGVFEKIHISTDFTKIFVSYIKYTFDETGNFTGEELKYIEGYTTTTPYSNYELTYAFVSDYTGIIANVSSNDNGDVVSIDEISINNGLLSQIKIYIFSTVNNTYELLQTITKNNIAISLLNGNNGILCLANSNANELYSFNNTTQLWELTETLAEDFTSLPFNRIIPFINDTGTMIFHSYTNPNPPEFDFETQQLLPMDYSLGYVSVYELS